MPRSLRLPPDLEEEIKRLAEEHRRSENAEIVVAVEQYIKSQKVCCLCDRPADLECKIGKCSPSKWYCSYHYVKEHPDGDE